MAVGYLKSNGMGHFAPKESSYTRQGEDKSTHDTSTQVHWTKWYQWYWMIPDQLWATLIKDMLTFFNFCHSIYINKFINIRMISEYQFYYTFYVDLNQPKLTINIVNYNLLNYIYTCINTTVCFKLHRLIFYLVREYQQSK